MFVKRNASGGIVAVSRERGPGFEEFLPIDAPEMSAFLGDGRQRRGLPQLSDTDLEMVRVIEDLIDLLIERQVIRFTDLPLPAQQKLAERRSLRLASRRLDLLDDNDG